MTKSPTVTVVGTGRLANILTRALRAAGYAIEEVVTRDVVGAAPLARAVGARPVSLNTAGFAAKVIWLCVPDREIQIMADRLSAIKSWNDQFIFHSSGALASDQLSALRRRGASVASVHPLMTFVAGSHPSLQNVPFGIEGDRAAISAARRIVRRLGGSPFPVNKRDKVLYHAWGTFASPLLISLLAATEQVARSTGISAKDARKKMLPILTQTLENYAALGPAKAFSGPIVRGDAATVRSHLMALKKQPEVREVYRGLARAALRYLPVHNRRQLEKFLDES